MIRSYRRGRNNYPSKRTFRTDFAVFHSSNPEKKKGDLARTTWYDSKLCSVQHEYLRTFIHTQRDDMSWYLMTKKFPLTNWFFETAKVLRIKTKLSANNNRNILASSSFPESFFGIKTEFQDVTILMQS